MNAGSSGPALGTFSGWTMLLGFAFMDLMCSRCRFIIILSEALVTRFFGSFRYPGSFRLTPRPQLTAQRGLPPKPKEGGEAHAIGILTPPI
jgi:hypothetical protein